MQIMRDPLTVCIGVTYERESIEKWIYTLGRNTCPATVQVLRNLDLTPNHTLCHLIQQWCITNSSVGGPPIATPDPPLDRNHLDKLLGEIEACPLPPFFVKVLKKLRSLAQKNEFNRWCIALSEALAILISLIESQSTEVDETYEVTVAWEEALGALHALNLPNEAVEPLVSTRCLVSLGSILKRGNSNARFNAAVLL
ncbi:hypothetical protein SUGI_1198180 [Cryptomeria japonica]|nr:hypothetical protein SUGI_1198180 [Cryptomeria japonica]